MRILFLYDCVFPESVGGVERRNWELGRILAQRGHQVTLAGWSTPEGAANNELEVLPLGSPGKLYNRQGRRSTLDAARFAAAVARLSVAPFDVVETANIPYAHLLPISLRCRLARVPLMVSWYEYWGFRYWRSYMGWAGMPHAVVERSSTGFGDVATAISALTRDRLRQRRSGSVPLVPGGIHLSAIQAATADSTQERSPLVYAGRLMREKRIDLLLEAVALLAKRQVSDPLRPLLTLVGTGPDRERLESLAGDLGIAERLHFTGYLETTEEVWREVGRARIAVQPSSREGFGLFPLEAMACGLPVVYCDSSENAVKELVRPQREGICAEPNPQALAEALSSLLADESQYAALAAGARERASDYDWEQVATLLEELLQDVVARR